MDSYPLILIPPTIQTCRDNFPSRPEVTAQRPPELEPFTHSPPKKPKLKSLVKPIVLGSLGGFVLSRISPWIGIAVIIIAIVSSVFIFIKERRRYSVKQQQYEERLSFRREREAQYQNDLRTYEAQEQALSEWQNQIYSRLQRVLIHTTRPGEGSRATKGWSERYFRPVLIRYFEDYIQTKRTLKNPEHPKRYPPYTADFAYIDEKLGLHIDIEIDEPYAYKSEYPIHYIGHEKDENRNQFFLDSGWIVIRFAEKQAILQAKSCCKVIAKTVCELLSKPIPSEYDDIPDLEPIPRWTRDEAEIMAETNYRDTYLNDYLDI